MGTRWLAALAVVAALDATATAQVRPEEVSAALEQWDVVGARALTDRLRRESPDDPGAEYLAGLVAYRGGWYDDAHAHLQRARELAPGLTAAAGLEALLYLDEGDDAAAAALVDDALPADRGSVVLSEARELIDLSARARAGRASGAGFPEGSGEEFVDALARAFAESAPSSMFADVVGPELLAGTSTAHARYQISHWITAARMLLRGHRAELVGWIVEPAHAELGPDPWFSVTFIVQRPRRPVEDRSPPAAVAEMADELRDFMDPGIRAAMDAAPPDQRVEVIERMTSAPRRIVVRLLLAVRFTAEEPMIVGARFARDDAEPAYAAVVYQRAGLDRAGVSHAMTWLWLAIGFLGLGAGIGALLWWRTSQERSRRRAARAR